MEEGPYLASIIISNKAPFIIIFSKKSTVPVWYNLSSTIWSLVMVPVPVTQEPLFNAGTGTAENDRTLVPVMMMMR